MRINTILSLDGLQFKQKNKIIPERALIFVLQYLKMNNTKTLSNQIDTHHHHSAGKEHTLQKKKNSNIIEICNKT